MADRLYFEIQCICSFILLLVYFLRDDRKSPDKSIRFYTVLSFLVMSVALTDGLTVRFNGVDTAAAWFITQFSSFYCDSASYIVCGMWFWWTKMWMGNPDTFDFRKNIFWMIPASAGIILMILNIPFHFIYWIDAANVFHRGPYFFILFIIPFLYILLSFIYPFSWFMHEKNEAEKRRAAFMACMMFGPIVASVIQLASFGLPLIWPSVAISLLAIYFKLQKRKTEEEKLAEERLKYELVKKDVDIMLSQLQPHFMYNVLTSIQGLAMTDPDKACEAITTFSSFMRGNMDSLSERTLIPFTEVLEHTKLYIALEQMRFGDRIHVIYNISADDFRLPPLMLEPLVENAVRYGITKKEKGGTIVISTEEKNNTIRITVSDDGVGFDPAAVSKDDRQHLGIPNVRDRLRILLGGDLSVTSTEGKGTTALITIPL
jgi:two-component system, LytTR family, sensor kinase